tara:strand:- start:2336 stop:2476 length:141 start_codon:yes stop_codon:yes gene_type:complete
MSPKAKRLPLRKPSAAKLQARRNLVEKVEAGSEIEFDGKALLYERF